MFRSVRAQVLVAVLTLVAAIFSWLGPLPVRVPVGLALAFVLPGLAIVTALFPNPTLTAVERCALVPATSIGSLVLIGLIMNAIGIKLATASWSAATVLSTVVCAAISAVRIRRGLASTVTGDASPTHVRLAPRRNQFGPLIGISLGVVMLVFASGWSVHNAKAHDAASFTTLWATEKVGGGRERIVEISVLNQEGYSVQYSLQVVGGSRPAQKLSFGLANGHVWTSDIQNPSGQRIAVQLFRDGGPVPYRLVFISGSQS